MSLDGMIERIQGESFAEQATGCPGAGDYAKWAEQQGYPYCRVINWTSSAGDWQFMVSPDGECWTPMYQNNNHPRPGFTRTIDESDTFYGSEEEALDYFCSRG